MKALGLRGDQIGIAMRDRTTQGELIEDTGTHAAEGAVSGAVGSGVLGGLIGFLVGIGALTIAGIGPVIAGGALASALGTAGAATAVGAEVGAATGGILGALVGMGVPEERARHFESRLREGGVIVTVAAYGRADEIRDVLERNGGDTGMHLGGSDLTSRRAA